MTEQLSLDSLLGEDAVRRWSRRRRTPRSAGSLGPPVPPRRDPSEPPLRLVGPGLSAREIAERLGRPEPTAEQTAVIEAPVAPLLVVAGAGSGKTETMASRVVWLVANGHVAPEQVLGLTFTRKAAAELAERVRTRLRALHRHGAIAEPAPVAVSTYHSYAASVVSDHGLRLGVEPGARLLGEAGAWQLVDEIVERWDGDMSAVESARGTVVECVLSLAAEFAEHLVHSCAADAVLHELVERAARLPKCVGDAGPAPALAGEVRKVVQRAAARRDLLPLVEAFARRKRELGLLDFGDQVALAAQLARDVRAVAAAERERFPVVLLDEYQDTSHAQLVLLRALFGDGHPVTAVGDPHQSIYGWRGASAGTLQDFPRHFPAADGAPATALHLSTSWRNDTAVLTVANTVAAPLRDAPRWVRSGHAVDVRPLTARPGAEGGSVQVQWHATVDEEMDALADAVERSWRSRSADGRTGPSIAVLCRARALFPLVEATLRRRGLPVEIVGLGGLLHVPEVADLRAVLEVVHDPARGNSLMRLLTGPSCRLGPRDLDALGAWAAHLARQARPSRRDGATARQHLAQADGVDERSIVEALDQLPDPGWRGPEGEQLSAAAAARLSRLAGTLRALRARTALALPDLVLEAERAMLLDVEVAAIPGRSPAAARAHLDAFGDVAAAFDDSGRRATLGAFLAWLDAAEDAERGLDAPVAEPSEDAVQVLTVHAAKGLEWDVVAVPGLVEGTFPAGTSGRPPGPTGGWTTDLGALPFPVRGDADRVPQWPFEAARSQEELLSSLKAFRADCGEYELAEERRLAYVAFTRAKHLLLLTGSVWGDGKTPRKPSRFLAEAAGSPAVAVPTWAPDPADGERNPRQVDGVRIAWPTDPLGERRAAVEDGAALVRSALTAGTSPGCLPASEWSTEIDMLLAERDAARTASLAVELPGHLSASRIVSLAQDPGGLAARLRRPMPEEPNELARRGSAFHAWLEQRFAAASLVDVDELPGAADDAGQDEALGEIQRRFLAGEWADRSPEAVEVSLETPVGGLLVRGRIDAVFRSVDTLEPGQDVWDVVDWKTGRPPTDPAEAAARSVQLAVYRLAWARLQGIGLDRVRAAFYYASTGQTVRPVDLLDAAGLEALVASAVAPGDAR